MGRLRPRFWGAGPTFALVILQAAVFVVSGCLLAPFDISRPGGPGTAWAFALPSTPALPLAVLALPDRPSRGEHVRAGVVVTLGSAVYGSGAGTSSSATSGSTAPRQSVVIEPVGYTVLPAAAPPRRRTPVAASPAPSAPSTTRKTPARPHHPHRAAARARVHQHRATAPARASHAHTRHRSAASHDAAHRQAC